MKSERLCVADLHVHTNLSLCAPPETTISSYLPFCEQEGIKKLGISNHLYSRKGVDYTLQIKDELQALRETGAVQILLGCEMEIFPEKEPMLHKGNASQFDYVLVAPSHIFNLMYEYKHYDLSTPDRIRRMLIDNFKRACLLDLGVPTAICHPLYPICAPDQQGILDGFTDAQLAECYTLAAQHHKSIEIHACLYRDTVTLDDEGLSPTYIHMLSVAKACGCTFHFGSDAHEPQAFVHKHDLLRRAAERAGIGEEDVWHVARA